MKPTAFLVAVTLLIAHGGCESKNDTVPVHLIGEWQTSDPQYADRFLEFTRRGVTFGTGGYSADVYRIDNVKVSRDKGQTLYTITYVDSDLDEYKLSFYYHTSDGGVITFKNQGHLTWKKQRS